MAMGCTLSWIGAKAKKRNEHNNTKLGELHNRAKILMINNDVEPMKFGCENSTKQESNNGNSNKKQKSKQRPLLAMLLAGRRCGIQSVKIDTCAGRTANELICDNNNNNSSIASSYNRMQTSGKEFRLNNNISNLIEPIERSSLLQVPSVNLASCKKRKSHNQTNNATKMHITETASNPSEGSEETQRIIQQQHQQETISQVMEQSKPTSASNVGPEFQITEMNDNFALNRRDSTDITLFTSIQQLCSDIIQRKLMQLFPVDNHGRVLCLFIFGCQGSAKGEIAFELVEHSYLINFLNSNSDSKQAAERDHCPLYHQIDVAAIIAANIDERIREYHQLSAQTTTLRQEQVALYGSVEPEVSRFKLKDEFGRENDGDREQDCCYKNRADSDEANVTPDIVLNDDDDDDDDDESGDKLSSITSENSTYSTSTLASTTNNNLKSTGLDCLSTDNGDSNLVTLTTKQRSILQLKLMKYFNSISSKWVVSLIQREVDRLELKLRQNQNQNANQIDETGENNSNSYSFKSDRIYLINLIPNQLSLFKSCLYLQQNLQLKDFHYPIYAMKFERRTNIKLLHKERSNIDNSEGNNKSKDGSQLAKSLKIPLRIPTLRLPKLQTTSARQTPSPPPSPPSSPVKQISSNSAKELGEVATNFLANGVNEKLGPKFNDNFAQQFKSINKLLRVRYNPIRDYNYSQHDDQDETRCWPLEIAQQQQQQVLNNNYDKNSAQDTNLRREGYLRAKIRAESETNPPCYRPIDRILSSSMQHIQADCSSCPASDENLDEIRHRLSLSRISPIGNISSSSLQAAAAAASIVTEPHSVDSISKNKLTPGSQMSSFLSSTSSLVSNSTISTLESGSDTNYENGTPTSMSKFLSSKRSSGTINDLPIKWAIGLELIDKSMNNVGSNLNKQDVPKGGGGGEPLESSPSRWRGSSSAGTKRQAADSVMGSDLAIGNSSNSSGRSDITNSTSGRPLGGCPKTNTNSIFFNEPKSASKSPLMFTAQHQRRPVTYQLLPVCVAYANHQSQLMFELKRMHPKTLRLKSYSDISRLMKLIGKAKRQVGTECQNWLYAALTKRGCLQACPSACNNSSSMNYHNRKWEDRKRHSMITGQSHNHNQIHTAAANTNSELGRQQQHLQRPTLIVQTICVDISRLKLGNFHYPQNFDGPKQSLDGAVSSSSLFHKNANEEHNVSLSSQDKRLVPILTLHSASNLEYKKEGVNANFLSESSELLTANNNGDNIIITNMGRPSSSRSAIIPTGSSHKQKPKRRVQFRLSQAPEGRWKRDERFEFDHNDVSNLFGCTGLKPERRHWFEDCVYISSTDETNLETMELLASLLRFHTSNSGDG